MSRATGIHEIDPPMILFGGETPSSFCWEVRFARVEQSTGNFRSSMPPFRDQEMVNLTWSWLIENVHGGFAFKDKTVIIFEEETDALLCFTKFA